MATKPMTLREKYPNAYEDANGMIWTSQDAAKSADWTYEHGDGFLEEVLGYDWKDAEENFKLYQRETKRKAFWRSHPMLRDAVWFLRRWWGAISMFAGIVGREWYEVRIGPVLAWQLAGDVWLR